MTELITYWLSGLTTGIGLSGALSSWSHRRRRRRRPRPSAPGPWDPQAIYLDAPPAAPTKPQFPPPRVIPGDTP